MKSILVMLVMLAAGCGEVTTTEDAPDAGIMAAGGAGGFGGTVEPGIGGARAGGSGGLMELGTGGAGFQGTGGTMPVGIGGGSGLGTGGQTGAGGVAYLSCSWYNFSPGSSYICFEPSSARIMSLGGYMCATCETASPIGNQPPNVPDCVWKALCVHSCTECTAAP